MLFKRSFPMDTLVVVGVATLVVAAIVLIVRKLNSRASNKPEIKHHKADAESFLP